MSMCVLACACVRGVLVSRVLATCALALPPAPPPGVVEDTRPDEGKVLVRPDMMKDQVVELELAEVQKLFQV